jgi:hypothetical protein
MVAAARQRLAPFGDRVECREALPPGCHSRRAFDAVASFAMLHHTVAWEQALGEAVRVLRSGGALPGYDLVASPPARALHRLDLSPHRLTAVVELSSRLGGLQQVLSRGPTQLPSQSESPCRQPTTVCVKTRADALSAYGLSSRATASSANGRTWLLLRGCPWGQGVLHGRDEVLDHIVWPAIRLSQGARATAGVRSRDNTDAQEREIRR